MDEIYKDDYQDSGISDRTLHAEDSGKQIENEVKEQIVDEFLSAESTLLEIQRRFFLPKYQELCQKLADIVSKIDISYYINEDFEKIIDILLDGALTPGEHHTDNLEVIFSLCEHQTRDIGEYLISKGLLNTYDELLQKEDMPEPSVALIIRTFASLAHISQRTCFTVLEKLTVFKCCDIIHSSQNQQILENCALYLSCVSRFPLNDQEVSSILEIFNFAIEQNLEFLFSSLSTAASHVCGREGQTFKIMNTFQTIHQLIMINDFNEITKVNMLNGISLSSKNAKIEYDFDVNIILSELDSENVTIASSAAHCISMLVQNRPEFLNSFDIVEFTQNLLELFHERSAYDSRKYVSEAVVSIASLLSGHQLLLQDKTALSECICFLIEKCFKETQPDMILIERSMRLVRFYFDSANANMALLEVSNAFDEAGGFQLICDIFDEQSSHAIMRSSLGDFLDKFMEDYAPAEYRPEEE